jgi:hypothetical protein
MCKESGLKSVPGEGAEKENTKLEGETSGNYNFSIFDRRSTNV